MVLPRLIFIMFIISVLNLIKVSAQGSDSIYINSYTSVKTVLNKESLKADSLVVENPSLFKKNDTVLLHQAKGCGWSKPETPPAFSGIEYSGRFEIQVVEAVVNDTIILRKTLSKPFSGNDYNPAAALQLVKVPSYKYYKSTKVITAPKFDGSKGGIVSIVADTFELDKPIDVSSKGFRGANPSSDESLALCWLNDTVRLFRNYYSNSAVDSAGLKGESVVVFDAKISRGRSYIGNGGGGGNGHFSGGGGGSSYGGGGRGGSESDECDSTRYNIGGSGGRALSVVQYFNNSNFYAIFGGGGGTSTSNSTYKAVKGGDGGGIVIIIANVLRTSNGKIISNGENITKSSAAGGAGGGAGGAVIFDVNKVIGNPQISVKGGDGGKTLGILNGVQIPSSGPGGGGGGGYILYKGETLFASTNLSPGSYGTNPIGLPQWASDGESGGTKGKLIVPIKGFLFNIMPKDQEICAGEAPQKFEASEPKGFSKYAFKWRKSLDLTNWVDVSTDLTYQAGTLYDTTFFQRIVFAYSTINSKDSLMDKDSSNILVVNVLPAILNNTIHTDTFEICKNKKIPIIWGNAAPLKGGNGVYAYIWQDSTSNGWITASGNNSGLNYLPSTNDSIKLRRVVKSGVCTHYSNTAKIDVLPLIKGNETLQDQYIEMGRIPTPLKSSEITGAKGVYAYQWLQSSNRTIWTNADGKFDSVSLVLPAINDTMYFKRIVRSGYLNTCTDTSIVVTLFVLDSIYNNNIGQNMIVCRQSAPLNDFTGSQPSGGDESYKYQWEVSLDLSSWDSLATISTFNFNPGILKKDCYFRRVVFSGPFNTCKDTSNVITIVTRPEIENAGLLKQDTIICNQQSPGLISAETPIGGDGPYAYAWYSSNDKTNWNLAEGVNNAENYTSAKLIDTTYFFRKINSGICVAFSDTIKVTVLPSIFNNSLSSIMQTCYGSEPNTILTQNISGGDGNFSYVWLKSEDSQTWNYASGQNQSKDYKPEILFANQYFKRIVFSGFQECCKDTSNSILLNVNTLPIASVENTHDSICLGNDYKLKLKVENGKADYKVTFSNGYEDFIVNFIKENENLISVQPDSASTYNYTIVEVTDNNLCTATDKTGLVTLNVFKIPDASVSPDTATCGRISSLKALPGIGKGKWVSHIPAKFLVSDTLMDSQVEIDSLYYGERAFTWVLNNGGCIDSASQKVVFYQPPPDPLVGEDKDGPFLFTTRLKAYLPVLGTGHWETPDTEIRFEDKNDPETEVSNLKFGDNIFLWHVENGLCKAASDTFNVIVEDIKVPNGLSPNGDNLNDIFSIKGLENITNAELTIINRWGKEVYKSLNYQNDWDGNSLPSDTYFYLLKVVGRTYKGYVVIKR